MTDSDITFIIDNRESKVISLLQSNKSQLVYDKQNLELGDFKYILNTQSTKTDINLFLDFANVWGVDYDSSLDNSNKLRSSTGVAASWISPLGPMTFTFSQNLSKADTDKTESFSFNLGASF